MMSGLVTPKSIEITDEIMLKQLLIKTRKLFNYNKYFNNEINFTISAFMCLIPYIIFTPLRTALIYGIPNSLIVGICGRYNFAISLWQLIYYYILCYYLKLKLISLNKRLTKPLKYREVLAIIQSFNRLYIEIIDYNKTYISKYLLTIWVLFGSCIMFGISALIFSEFTIIIKLTMFYVTSLAIIIFALIILTASSLNSLANKSYKLFIQQLNYQIKFEMFIRLSFKYKV